MIFRSPYYRPAPQAAATTTTQAAAPQGQGMGWSAIQDALTQAGAYNPFAGGGADGQWDLGALYRYARGGQNQGDTQYNVLDNMANLYLQQNPSAYLGALSGESLARLTPLQRLFAANPFFGQWQPGLFGGPNGLDGGAGMGGLGGALGSGAPGSDAGW